MKTFKIFYNETSSFEYIVLASSKQKAHDIFLSALGKGLEGKHKGQDMEIIDIKEVKT